MTDLQKYIVGNLLNGYNITGNEKYGYRLRSPRGEVCRKFYGATFHTIKPLLRNRGGQFLINKTAVRKLHGRAWPKKRYKDLITKKIIVYDSSIDDNSK